MNASFGSRSSSLYDWETRYTGYRFDNESALYLARFRWLNDAIGGWLSRDRLGYSGGDVSLYQYVQGRPLCSVDPMGLKEYDREGLTLFSTLIFGGYMHPGDTVIHSNVGTINVMSENLEDSDDDYGFARCALKALGLYLPTSENGVYWAQFPRGVQDHGSTVLWTGLGGDDLNFTFIDIAFKGATKNCNSNALKEFLVTLYHEVQGHNIDEASHDDPAQTKAFNDKYEKPVKDALGQAKASGAWADMCKKCQDRNKLPHCDMDAVGFSYSQFPL